MFLDQHTDFSGSRSGGVVFPSLEEFSAVCCAEQTQVAGKVIGYSHLLKNFPQFVVIHTVRGFSVVNEAEVDIFREFSLPFL